ETKKADRKKAQNPNLSQAPPKPITRVLFFPPLLCRCLIMDPNASVLVDNNASNEIESSDTQPTRRRKRKSMVWDHFTTEVASPGITKAFCKHCHKSYAYQSGTKASGTSHLKRHIELDFIGEIPGAVNLTVDLWSSSQSVGYAFVTGHFVDKDWNLNHRLLTVAVVASPDSDTALNQPIAACLSDWKLEGKISSITVNQSVVSKTCIDNLRGFLSVRNQHVLNGQLLMGKCYARLLSSMAQDALAAEQLQSPIKKVRDSIKYVKTDDACGDKFVAQEPHFHQDMPQATNTDMPQATNTDMPQATNTDMPQDTNTDMPQGTNTDMPQDTNTDMPQETNTGNGQSGDETSPQVEQTTKSHPVAEEEQKLGDDSRAAEEDDTTLTVEEITESHQDERQPKVEKPSVEGVWKGASEECQLTENGQQNGDDSQAHPIAEEDHMLFAGDVLLQEGSTLVTIGDSLSDFEFCISEIKPELNQYLEETLIPRSEDFDVLSWWRLNSTSYPTLAKMAADLLSIPFITVSPDSAAE
ncbi:unnamed protein product, partial [Thlaspi arvense]